MDRRGAATVVLGLGSPLLRDDAAGLRVAAALEDLLAADPVGGVMILTSMRGGFHLIDLLAGAERAIILDCLDVPDPEPGRIRRLTLEDVAGGSRLVGAHDLSVGGAFELAAAMGIPMPGEVEIFAIEGADTRTFSERLTPAVEAAVATLSRDLHAHLKEQERAAGR